MLRNLIQARTYRINKFSLGFWATATLMFVILSLFGLSRLANVKASRSVPPVKAKDTKLGCCGGDEANKKEHVLAGSSYTVKDGFSAKLLLNNKGPVPIEVQPTLFSLKGARFNAPLVTVVATAHLFIDFNDWVTLAGEQFREGSVQLNHVGKDLVLGTQIYLTHETHSLSFEEKLTELGRGASTRLEGVWWLPSPKGEVTLVLSNTTDGPLTVSAKILGEEPKRAADITLDIQPHETTVLNSQRYLVGKMHAAMSSFGSISVSHNSRPGDVLARAMAADSDKGFSLPIQFADPGGGKSNRLQGAGLRIGRVRREPLSQKVVVHNAGQTATTVTGRVPYTKNDKSMTEVYLSPVELAPDETKVIDVSSALESHGIRRNEVVSAGVELEHTGPLGSLITSAFSVSLSGNHVLRVPLWDIAAQRSATGGYPWYIEGDSSTMIYIKNVTAVPQHYRMYLKFSEGEYDPGLTTVSPGQTEIIDVRALRDSQIADVNGKTIPLHETQGQVQWSMTGGVDRVLIGRSEQVDIVAGTSSNYACQNCCGNSFYDGWVTPGESNGIEGYQLQFTAMQRDANCYGQVYLPYTANIPSYFSSDNSVCDPGFTGMTTGVGPGWSIINASWTADAWFMGLNEQCEFTPVQALREAICEVAGVTISGPQSVQDGASFLPPTFTLTPQGGVPTGFDWTWSAPIGAGNNPVVIFTPPNTPATTTNGHWFANPNVACPFPPFVSIPPVSSDPYYNANYTIRGEATFVAGTSFAETSLTVNAFWSPAGTTAPPLISGGPSIAFDSSAQLWRVVGSGTLSRNAPQVVIYVPITSQFYNKTVAHEARHVFQYTSGLNSDLYLVSSLMAQLSPLTDATENGLLLKMVAARDQWYLTQDIAVLVRRSANEADAYSVSDVILPQYAYQGCQ